MSIPNGNIPSNNNTVVATDYFNNFFTAEFTVTQNVDDAVIAYFESITGNKETARVLASTVLYTALSQGIEPMSVIEELRNLQLKNRAAMGTQSSYTSRTNENTDQYAKPGPPPRANLSELDAYLTMLLNLNRVSTSLLGISNQPQTNKYIQRAILP